VRHNTYYSESVREIAFHHRIIHNTSLAIAVNQDKVAKHRESSMEQGILDILYQVLTSPSEAFSRVSERKPLRWALLTAVFISIVSGLTLLPNLPEFVETIFGLKRGGINTIPIMVIWVIIFLVALLIEAGIFQLIVALLRGKGGYLGMVCGLCFAYFPLVFFAPLALLRALLGFPGHILYSVGTLIFLLWCLILVVIAIRQNYNFSLGKAIATCFIPGILLVIIPLVAVAISMAL